MNSPSPLLHHLEFDLGVKCRVGFQQVAEAADPGHLVGFGAPVEAWRLVNDDLLGGVPFDAVGEAEGAVVGQQRAQRGAHPGVGRRAGSQAVVVMGFGKMHHQAVAAADLQRLGQIVFDLPAVVVLKQLGVGGVEVGAAEDLAGDRHLAPQALQQKDGVGKLAAHAGHDVAPGLNRYHITGVAAKPVDAPPAPPQKDLGHVAPEVLVAEVQAGQVLPAHAPGPGHLDAALGVAGQPLGVGLVQAGGPTRVVDGDIQVEPGVALVDGVDQFDELLQRGGLGVELRQGRIDLGEAQGGIRAAEAAHAGVGRGGGVDGQKLQDAAAQFAHDEVQFADQIAEGPRRRNDRVAVPVQGRDAFAAGRVRLKAAALVGAELAHEGIVNDVGGTGFGRGDVDHGVVAGGPDRFAGAGVQEKTLGLKMAHLAKRQGYPESARGHRLQGDVKPVARERRKIAGDGVDNLAAGDVGMPDIGSHPGAARGVGGGGEFEAQGVAPKMKQMAARCRHLADLVGDVHEGITCAAVG